MQRIAVNYFATLIMSSIEQTIMATVSFKYYNGDGDIRAKSLILKNRPGPFHSLKVGTICRQALDEIMKRSIDDLKILVPGNTKPPKLDKKREDIAVHYATKEESKAVKKFVRDLIAADQSNFAKQKPSKVYALLINVWLDEQI